VDSLSYYTGTEPERSRKTSDRIDDVPAEIRTEQLPVTGLQHCRWITLILEVSNEKKCGSEYLEIEGTK
jgi:hypothetical protein